MRHLTAYVKKNREDQNISQGKLAAHFGLVNGQYISNIENGKAHYPPKYFKGLCKFLNLNIKEMISLDLRDYKEEIEGIVYGKRNRH